MQDRLRKMLVIYSLLFFVAAMSAMLYAARYKVIRIQDVSQDQVEINGEVSAGNEGGNAGEGAEKMLHFQTGGENTNYLCIPLPKDTKAEAVSIENYYMEKELWISIRGVPEDFYETEGVFGNISKVSAGFFEYQDETVRLRFELKDIYECRSILEEDHIYIELVAPREIYDKIIVIDAGHGGDDTGLWNGELTEKEITLDIAKRVKEKLDGTDIKVYYTRMEDKEVSEESRIWIANAAKADLFISIHLNSDSDSRVYGTETLYNGEFFIPGFGSLELSDILEREVVTAISGKGNGLFEAGEEETALREACVPAALLQAGYVSNPQEAILLEREDYRERIADGIVNAVMKSYAAMEEKENQK